VLGYRKNFQNVAVTLRGGENCHALLDKTSNHTAIYKSPMFIGANLELYIKR
jgi:hypothetical protein